MNCPNCNEKNPRIACFCHNCGYKLKKSELDELNEQVQKWQNRSNGWLILFISCVTSMGIMGYNSFKDYQEINHMKSLLPQTYYTKHPKQYFYYNCTGTFYKSECYAKTQGTQVIVYQQGRSEGDTTLYGLTSSGWIPMHLLEKK